jgi:UDPglucose 6-dehydrogenase
VKPVGVVGLGVVGGTVSRAFAQAGVRVSRYDAYKGLGRARDLQPCGVVFICVPTPIAEDGRYVLEEVWAALDTIEPHLERGTIVAMKSTVPPGTSDRLAAGYPRLAFASVPEFLLADRPMETFTRPDRVVIGARDTATTNTLAELMARVAPAAPIMFLLPTEAELVKLCSNAMLSAKVALANELFEICGRFGVEWGRVQAGVGLDRRIGPDHLTVTAERGFGGACLPKDLEGLIAAARDATYDPALLVEIAGFNRRIREEARRSLERSSAVA